MGTHEKELITAVECRDCIRVRSLLDAGANPNIFLDGLGEVLLSRAVVGHLCNPEIIKALLGAGADPNKKDKLGNTVLENAVSSPCPLSVVESLLEAGADPREVDGWSLQHLRMDSENDAAVDVAITLAKQEWEEHRGLGSDFRKKLEGKITAVQEAARRKAQAAPLIRAAVNLDQSKVSSLLAGGVDVNVQDVEGHTALMAAVYSSNDGAHSQTNLSMLRYLLEAGADPNIKSSVGETAIYFAARYNKPHAIDLLMQGGTTRQSVEEAVSKLESSVMQYPDATRKLRRLLQ